MKLDDSQIGLIMYMIGFVHYDKEQFQFYMDTIYGKEYSEKEIVNMVEHLRQDIKIQRFK
ncbi:hypothetical protein F1257_05520 [Clostridioides difficile]|uniref:hypothetical protein n=1 Tax=Clostridioides difficile TaxID=1496 RepID=UPI00038DB97D|nr:hypothetical protein [Clostridioides difficile]EGT3659692.1 hypothetical protein [Clostridioides difficile]EGT4176428.1 hypothetical protein [Clostridioides difficile]EGT5488482.1 hypothetical protein [Clostridioides difficile]EJA6689272.1 hypothetical protein [Clostridioides difficile]EJA6785269.1 hypothetical protein [Clostridioides difficile]